MALERGEGDKARARACVCVFLLVCMCAVTYSVVFFLQSHSRRIILVFKALFICLSPRTTSALSSRRIGQLQPRRASREQAAEPTAAE